MAAASFHFSVTIASVWLLRRPRLSNCKDLGAGGRPLGSEDRRFQTQCFVASSGRRFRRPVFFDLRRGWSEPFVASSSFLAEDLADEGSGDSMGCGDLGQ